MDTVALAVRDAWMPSTLVAAEAKSVRISSGSDGIPWSRPYGRCSYPWDITDEWRGLMVLLKIPRCADRALELLEFALGDRPDECIAICLLDRKGIPRRSQPTAL